MADLKWGLAPGCSVPGLNLIQRVGCLSPFPDSRLSKARLLKIGGIHAAPSVAEGLQIAANDGALHAELVGDLLPGEFGEVQLHGPPSPFGQRLANTSFFGHGRTPVWVAARIRGRALVINLRTAVSGSLAERRQSAELP
jgi:hypothetical protein